MNQYPKLPEGRPRERYRIVEGRGVEGEVADLLFALVCMCKPELVIETGTHVGDSSEAIGRALRANGFGHLETCDVDEAKVRAAQQRLADYPVLVHLMKGEDLLRGKSGTMQPMDFVHIDSGDPATREAELMLLDESNISPGGVVCWHDACVGYENMYRAFAAARDWPHVVFPSVVGFAVFQRPW